MTFSRLRVGIYAAILLLAVGAAYLATRSADGTPSMDAGQAHGATGDGRAATPVTLTAEQARRIGVTYATAIVGPAERDVRTVGQVTYDETRIRSIAPKLDGWVERLFVNETGRAVSVGEPLFSIYSPMLVTAQEELLLAKRLQHDVAIASGDAQASATNLLASARQRLAYLDIPEGEIAEVERTGEVHRTLTLRSPVAGYVVEKTVVAGQKIMAGDPLFRVVDLSAVWVEGEVFEQDLDDVRVGQVVDAELQALPGEHRMGRIAYVYPTVNPDTRTARVRMVMSNADLRLKPGMYATLRIIGRPRAAVLTIPREAVLSTGTRDLVFVREGSGQLTPREVTLGATYADRVEIRRGLVAGDVVVASGTFLVDAESNLGKAIGGMGDMPGMDMREPAKKLPIRPARPQR